MKNETRYHFLVSSLEQSGMDQVNRTHHGNERMNKNQPPRNLRYPMMLQSFGFSGYETLILGRQGNSVQYSSSSSSSPSSLLDLGSSTLAEDAPLLVNDVTASPFSPAAG